MVKPYENGEDSPTSDEQAVDTNVYSLAFLKVLFDFIFLGNYALGWALTIAYQPEFVWNNNITRVFNVYNICIGVDSLPAQPIALIIYVVAFSIISSYMFVLWHSISLTRDRVGKCFQCVRRTLVLLAWFFCSLFFLTYGVRPDSPILAFIHDSGFAGGMLGYTLISLLTVVEFKILRDNQEIGTRGRLYELLQIVSGAGYFVAFLVLVQALATKPIAEMVAYVDSSVFPAHVEGGYFINDTKPDHLFSGKYVEPMHNEITFGVGTPLLVTVVFLTPILSLPLMPTNMKLKADWSMIEAGCPLERC